MLENERVYRFNRGYCMKNDADRQVKIIVLGTGDATANFIKKNINSRFIKIVGLILDSSVGNDIQRDFIKDLYSSIPDSIPMLNLSEDSLALADITFSPEYRRIIPTKYCEKYLMVNCHGGILPKWRGFAANAWAIMNGEKEIGYSIHRITGELDGGEIYFIKSIPITENETYSDVHKYMIESIAQDVPKVLYDIVTGSVNCTQQSKKYGIAYCTKFNVEMGNLKDFSMRSQYYVNLYRCMAEPLGTGVYFEYRGNKYSVGRIESGKKYGSIDYICTPGKIVNIERNCLWVKTYDNVIVLSNISVNGIKLNVNDSFRNGINLTNIHG